MPKRLFIVLLLFFGISACFQIKIKDKINGVNLVSPHYQADSLHFNNIYRINAGWVGIIPYGFSEQGRPEVTFDHNRQWWGEKSEGTREMIRLAHKNGFKVMLKPHIWMRGGWIGEFDLNTEKDWLAWESSYEKYILNFARIAAEEKVAILCIATEFKIAAVKRPEYWKRLITSIRSVYEGNLTYAANWDNYQNIEFWQDLDYIGIDAYFPLVADSDPHEESIVNAWNQKMDELKRYSQLYEKPILFTEYGYQSVNGAAGEHWAVSKSSDDLNMGIQARAYESLFKTIWKEDWMAGGFLWKWHLKDERGGLDDPNWTPQMKPAEQIISKYYKQ